MGTKFQPADEVKEIAIGLIEENHPRLFGIRIEYLFIDKIPKKGTKQVWGSCRKITNLTAYLADRNRNITDEDGEEPEPFFAIVISRPIWEVLPYEKKLALVDHELCHAGVEETDDGGKKLFIISHDLEEFAEVVKRHGIWEEGIEVFIKAAKEKLERDNV